MAGRGAWDAIARGANAVWKEIILKHPDTILTSDAAKKAVEILKQKVMGGTSAAGSTLPPDPSTVDWKGKVPFPDFSNASSSSSPSDTQVTNILSQRIHEWLRSVPLETVSERIRNTLHSIPTPDSEFVWFVVGGVFAIALANILFGDESSSSSSSDDDDPKNKDPEGAANDAGADAKYAGADAEDGGDDAGDDANDAGADAKDAGDDGKE